MSNTKETKRKRDKSKIKKIIDILSIEYSDAKTDLQHTSPFELLIATMLSAQCTDKRVNIVTKDLYKKYDTLHKFANAKQKELEMDIHSVGFYHNKAKNIIECAKMLITDYKGKIPKDFDDLVKLPGVGRKTASVVISHLYGIPAMAVDTHVARISNSLFKLNTKDVREIEEYLKETIDKKYWELWNTHIIALGREICIARKPKCDICPLYALCK